MANGGSFFGRLIDRLFGRPSAARGGGLVVLDLDYEAGRLHIVLANSGSEPALNVSVDFDRPLMGLGGSEDFATLPVFSDLPVLRPGKAIRLFLDAGPSISAIGPFTATVRWQATSGASRRARYRHDTAIFRRWPEVIAP